MSNGFGTLTIDLGLMSDEQRQKVYEAEALLMEAGIAFDVNETNCYRKWELDWSLRGATLTTRPTECMTCRKPVKANGHWAVFTTPRGRNYLYPYCSLEHRKKGISQQQRGLSWQCLIRL